MILQLTAKCLNGYFENDQPIVTPEIRNYMNNPQHLRGTVTQKLIEKLHFYSVILNLLT